MYWLTIFAASHNLGPDHYPQNVYIECICSLHTNRIYFIVVHSPCQERWCASIFVYAITDPHRKEILKKKPSSEFFLWELRLHLQPTCFMVGLPWCLVSFQVAVSTFTHFRELHWRNIPQLLWVTIYDLKKNWFSPCPCQICHPHTLLEVYFSTHAIAIEKIRIQSNYILVLEMLIKLPWHP